MSADSLSVPLYFVIVGAIIFLNALIVLSNTAFTSVNNNLIIQRLEEENIENKNVLYILDRPFKLRFTNRFINYLLLIAGTYFTMMMPYNDIISVLIYFVVMVSLGELMPRKLGIQHSENLVLTFAGFQKFLMIIATPFVAVVTLIGDLFLKRVRQETKIEYSRYSEDEVMSILEVGQQSGEIKEEGKKMINSIFEFDDELAYEIMTPRTDVFMFDIDDDPEEYQDELMKLRYSRIPVCEGETDNIIGILHIKDYLIKAREQGFENVDIREILRKPYFVPETKNIDALFFELQKERQHIAILIDEYGGFSGIVTMEDIIEEIVGEIDDEYDKEEFALKQIDDNVYIVSGKSYLDDLNEELGIDLESENSETLGGLVIEQLGEIPADGGKGMETSYKNYRFTILSVHERRIEKIKLEVLPEEEVAELENEDQE